ncbi:MAG: DUF899 family protein [Hyphomonadaceae bacterium]|nr:DUF899 family protein [Hyphomonadaceae bacterium]
MTAQPKIVNRMEWMAQREALLAAEKAFTHERDALSARRREMPWVRIDQDYVFEGPDGDVSLEELFNGRRQLIVYHLMFAPEWEWACKSCSYWADQFDGAIPHLRARDTSFVAISRAPLDKLQRHAKRLGWEFLWVSARKNRFAFDFGFSFEPEAHAKGEAIYNFRAPPKAMSDLPGFTVFSKGPEGAVYQTYNIQGRGQDITNGAYNLLDFTAKGRDEDGLPFPMKWVKLHDEYGAA